MSTAKQTKANKEQLYALHLWDAATPGFCSFDKMYIGTEEDIIAVAKAMENGNHYPDTVKAIRAYFKGDKTASHNVVYREIPILKPVILKAKRRLSLESREWEHLNTWQWPYNMRFDSAEISQILVKYEAKYYRCIRAKMKNLQYESVTGKYEKLDSHYWGNTFVLKLEHEGKNFTLENMLYIGEIAYAKYKEAKAEFESDNLLFSGICDEIFGDG